MDGEIKTSEMTEFGKALWMHMQDKGPYNRASFAKLLGRETGWEPSRQAISNYLKGDRPVPSELVPAAVQVLGLDEEAERELQRLYFYGQSKPGARGRFPGGARTERDFDEAIVYERERDATEGQGDEDGAADDRPS